jgi:putative transposase
MPRTRHKPEEIVSKLRQVDVLVAQGTSVAEAIRSIGVTEVGSGTSCSMGRSSPHSERFRSSSRAGGGTTTVYGRLPLQVGCRRGRLWMPQSIRPVAGAITPLAMMRIRFSSPHKVHGREGQVVVQAEEWRSVPTCHHPPRIGSARSAPIS